MGRLRFALELAIAGAVITATFPLGFVSHGGGPLPTWLVKLLLLAYGFTAIAALTGYILVSWELPPVKAMLFGTGSIAAAWLAAYVSDRFELVVLPHAAAGTLAMALWFLTGCGLVAFAIGLLRFGLRFWRKS